MRRNCKVTLYQDAHVGEDVPPLSDTVERVHANALVFYSLSFASQIFASYSLIFFTVGKTSLMRW